MGKFKVFVIGLEISTFFDQDIGCILYIKGVIDSSADVVFNFLIFWISWGMVLLSAAASVLGHDVLEARSLSTILVFALTIWQINLRRHTIRVWIIIKYIFSSIFLELLNKIIGHRFLRGLTISFDDFHDFLRKISQLVRCTLMRPLRAFRVCWLWVAFWLKEVQADVICANHISVQIIHHVFLWINLLLLLAAVVLFDVRHVTEIMVEAVVGPAILLLMLPFAQKIWLVVVLSSTNFFNVLLFDFGHSLDWLEGRIIIFFV